MVCELTPHAIPSLVGCSSVMAIFRHLLAASVLRRISQVKEISFVGGARSFALPRLERDTDMDARAIHRLRLNGDVSIYQSNALLHARET